MKNKDQRAEHAAELRRRAEATLREKASPSSASLAALTVGEQPPADRGTVEHELSVHQIELEMQNEELRQSQMALNASLKRYLDLYDLAPVGYCTVGDDGLIRQANLTLSALLGIERASLVKQNFSTFILSEDQDRYYLACRQLIKTATPLSCELRIVQKDGKTLWTHLAATVARVDNGPPELRVVLSDISERKQMDAKLKKSESFNQAILDSVSAEISVLDSKGTILSVNQPWRRFASENGVSPGNLVPSTEIGANYLAACRASADEHAMKVCDGIQAVIEGQVPSFGIEYPCRFTQRQRWFSMVITPLGDGAVVTHTEITELKLAEERLRLAASVFSHAREGIMITGADNTIVDVNETFTRITGYSREEAIGKKSDFLATNQHEAEILGATSNDLNEKGHWYGEVWNRRKNGEQFAAMQSISSIRDAQGKLHHYVILFSDITSLKAYQKQLQHIAHYDVLTTLPNRVLLADRLHQAMTQALRHKKILAVAYLDLDGFKAINDCHGHEAGDKLLRILASRMKHAMREGDTLARLGGDEFVAVLAELDDEATSEPMLDRLLAAASRPVPVNNLLLQVSASVGVTFYPQVDDIEADLLLRQADQAMYQAKLAGKNRYHIFDAELDRSVRGHHESLERIRRALSAGEFVLHYQPKVNVRIGKVTGAEALIRWRHPERGLLDPAVFMPVIEDHPLAVEIGEWVIDAALSQMATWQAAGLHIPVSVNVGARQLQQADFVERLSILLASHPEVNPCDLELEVLETSALQDLARTSEVIEACRKIGVTFSLDDFGTGYSSLTYLKHLPVKQLKIDQSFVRGMLNDPDDLAILESVMSLAIAFQRQVTAEGVETVEHGEMLLQLGCELAQGFGIARPMPADELPAWTASWRPDPMWIGVPPINHADLPLLFAGAEYRAWIAIIASYLRGERQALPPNHQNYRFDTWLDTERLTHHRTQPAFHTIMPLHREVHALADRLLKLHAAGQRQEALERLPELLDLRDALLGQLRALMLGSRA